MALNSVVAPLWQIMEETLQRFYKLSGGPVSENTLARWKEPLAIWEWLKLANIWLHKVVKFYRRLAGGGGWGDLVDKFLSPPFKHL